MRNYVVIKRGVYRHEVWGVLACLDDARALARRMLELERDDYHHAEVVSFPVAPEAAGEPECLEGAVYRADRKRLVRDDTVRPGYCRWEAFRTEYAWFTPADRDALLAWDAANRTYDNGEGGGPP